MLAPLVWRVSSLIGSNTRGIKVLSSRLFLEWQWCQSHLKGRLIKRRSGTAHSTSRRPSLMQQSRCCSGVWEKREWCENLDRHVFALYFRNGQKRTSMASSNYPWKMSSSQPTLRSTLSRKSLHQRPPWSRQVSLLSYGNKGLTTSWFLLMRLHNNVLMFASLGHCHEQGVVQAGRQVLSAQSVSELWVLQVSETPIKGICNLSEPS